MKKSSARPSIKKSPVRVDPTAPCAEHLAWHKRHTIDHESIRTIAVDVGRAPSTIHEAIGKVDFWIRQCIVDDVIECRFRQTETLDHMAAAALRAWRESIGKVVTTTHKDGRDGEEITTRTEISQGNAAYLSEARAAMSDIRKMWGVDKPAKVEVSTDQESAFGLDRVAGISRAEAIRKEAEKMLTLAVEIERIDGPQTIGE